MFSVVIWHHGNILNLPTGLHVPYLNYEVLLFYTDLACSICQVTFAMVLVSQSTKFVYIQ